MIFDNNDLESLNQTVSDRISKRLYHTYENDRDSIWVYFPYNGVRIRCIHEEHWDSSLTRRFYLKEDSKSPWEHFATSYTEHLDGDWTNRIGNLYSY